MLEAIAAAPPADPTPLPAAATGAELLHTNDVFRLVYQVRPELIAACAAVDTAAHGVVSRDAFAEATKTAGLRLSSAEGQALLDFADIRGDRQIPYRAALRRVAVALGRAGPDDAVVKRPPGLATVADFWKAFAKVLHVNDKNVEDVLESEEVRSWHAQIADFTISCKA